MSTKQKLLKSVLEKYSKERVNLIEATASSQLIALEWVWIQLAAYQN